MVKIKKSSWDSAIPNKFLNETVSCPQTHLSQWNHYVVLYLKRSRELSRHIIWLTSSFMYAIITLLLASKLKIYMSKKKKKRTKRFSLCCFASSGSEKFQELYWFNQPLNFTFLFYPISYLFFELTIQTKVSWYYWSLIL